MLRIPHALMPGMPGGVHAARPELRAFDQVKRGVFCAASVFHRAIFVFADQTPGGFQAGQQRCCCMMVMIMARQYEVPGQGGSRREW